MKASARALDVNLGLRLIKYRWLYDTMLTNPPVPYDLCIGNAI